MAKLDLSSARKLVADADATQLDVWNYMLQPDVKWVDTVKKKRELMPFFEADPGDVVDTLSRPRKADDAWFEKHGARSVENRTIHAVQAVEVGGAPMALVYTSAFLANDLGMNERYAVAEVDGDLKIVSRQVYSTDSGWQHAGGRDLAEPKPTGDVKRITPPDHEASRAIYDELS